MISFVLDARIGGGGAGRVCDNAFPLLSLRRYPGNGIMHKEGIDRGGGCDGMVEMVLSFLDRLMFGYDS